MELLILGLVIWSATHLIPSTAQPLRQRCINLLGSKGYSGAFAFTIVVALIAIVLGWRSISPELLYTLPAISRPIAIVLMFFAFMLFAAAKLPSRIKQFIRHPQLTAVVVWSAGHLLVNGDSRSLLLFGWLGCWSIIEMVLISRRDGVWIKPPITHWQQDLKALAVGFALFVITSLAHPYIAGVAIR